MRWLLRLLLAPALITVAAGAVADLWVRAMAERSVESVVGANAGLAGRVDVHTDFPFLAKVVPVATLPHLDIDLYDVGVDKLAYHQLSIAISDARLERSALLRRQLRLTGVGEVTVTAELTAGALTVFTGNQVTVGDGTVSVRSAAGPATSALRIEGRTLVLASAPGATVSVPLPPESLLPCARPSVEIIPDRVRLRCTAHAVPTGVAAGLLAGG